LITKVEALNYRSLRNVQQELGPFHVLVGANASGKTTFLDVIAFLSDLIAHGPGDALSKRSRNFLDLLWGRTGNSFALAIEALIPERLRPSADVEKIRYEVTLGPNGSADEGAISERLSIHSSSIAGLLLKNNLEVPSPSLQSGTIGFHSASPEPWLLILRDGGSNAFYSFENGEPDRLSISFKLPRGKAALAALPGVEKAFPVATWFQTLLAYGIKAVELDSRAMRAASPSGQSSGFKPDGSNLPWVVEELRKKHPEQFKDWIDHLRTVLPDLVGVRTVDREDDRHRYLMIQYRGGLEVPSWMTSDGTLRLMALTLLAYLPERDVVYLIEEPENGIHPRGIEAIYQSLSNVYDAQVLLATHSSLILGLVEAEQLLCFSKDQDGATEIVRGPDHPNLKGWKGETNLATLFAAGVLG
jgi:predicted ATPase